METTIITAIIAAASSLFVCIITNVYQNNVTRKLIEYKLTELEKRVEKHNTLIERTYELEKKVAILEETVEDKK